MPALSITPPREGSYRFVLQFRKLVAVPGETHPILLAGYDEASKESVGVQLPGQPVMRHTVFCSKLTTRDKAIREGWEDVTAAWEAHLRSLRPKVSTQPQRAVLGVLTNDWQDKATIVAASGIADTEWRTTVKLMEERGLVECNVPTDERGEASNRAYRYRRGPRYGEALDVVDEVEGG